MPKDQLPAGFVSKLEDWIPRVLRPELRPRTSEDIVMLGVPKLHWQTDFVVGRSPCQSCDAPDKSKAVEFQATEIRLYLTLHSASIKVPVVASLTEKQVMSVASRFLAIPEDKIQRFTVKHDCADADDVRVCHGDLLCEYDESDREKRKWWNYMAFWMADGALFIDLAMVDWELGDGPRANRKPIWPLRPSEKSAADFDPDVAKRPLFRGNASLPGLGAGPDFRLDSRDFRILPRDKISQEAIDLMKSRYERVLNPGVLPGSAKDDVEWQCLDVYAEYAPLLNPMMGKWVRDGVGVSVFGAPKSETLEVTLKFTGDKRIAIRVPTEEESRVARGGGASPPDAIEKEVMRRVLTEYFRFPFANLDDFELLGGGGGLEDVPVFMGRVRSRYAATELAAQKEPDYARLQAAHAKLKWYDTAQLFITDSDPQYFCITIGRLGSLEPAPGDIAPK